MKIAVLTSSRADYSIYLPLLKKLAADPFFGLNLVAFGTHLSEKFGYTLRSIEQDGFTVTHAIHTLPSGDSAYDISKSVGETMMIFARLWNELKAETDLIFCLGDRYEMFAAVAATVPFNIRVAHLHGGETTLGAMDNIYRHCITHMASYHFASTERNAERIIQLKADKAGVYNVGSLSLENLHQINLLSAETFSERYQIPINKPVLVTFHPETMSYEKNEDYARELVKALTQLSQQIIITMPNADTTGNVIREAMLDFAAGREQVYTVESLGMLGYFSCLNLCDFVLGNSSSGIIEAASFGKYVINLGDRQKGRDAGNNVIHCVIDSGKITEACLKIKTLPPPGKMNIYDGGNVSDKIVGILKQLH